VQQYPERNGFAAAFLVDAERAELLARTAARTAAAG
jgi:hypothetical protein